MVEVFLIIVIVFDDPSKFMQSMYITQISGPAVIFCCWQYEFICIHSHTAS